MKFKRIFLLAALLLSALSVPLHAQGTADAPEDYKRARIQDLIIMRLNNELGLNPSQSEKLAQAMKKFHEQKASLRRQQRDLTSQLREASGGGNEAQVKSLLKQIASIRNQLDQADDQMFNDIKPMLTPMQQAKYLLVMDEIRQEVKAIRRPAMTAPGYAPTGPTGNQDSVHVGPPYY